MSCLFSDDIAGGAKALDTLAIGVTGYSHSSRRRMKKKGVATIAFLSGWYGVTSSDTSRVKIVPTLDIVYATRRVASLENLAKYFEPAESPEKKTQTQL